MQHIFSFSKMFNIKNIYLNKFYEWMHIVVELVFNVDVVEFIHDELENEVYCTVMGGSEVVVVSL